LKSSYNIIEFRIVVTMMSTNIRLITFIRRVVAVEHV
jgi:hypothetical protein